MNKRGKKEKGKKGEMLTPRFGRSGQIDQTGGATWSDWPSKYAQKAI
jgi:hypothetical protein